MKKLFFLLLVLLLLVACSSGDEAVSVEGVWSRPAAAGENSAVYFLISNPGGADDVLLAVQGDIAEKIELHMSMAENDGVMKMQAQESVAVPSNSSIEFAPGGFHVMLMGLKKDLAVGDTFNLTLQFQDAGDTQIEVVVEER